MASRIRIGPRGLVVCVSASIVAAMLLICVLNWVDGGRLDPGPGPVKFAMVISFVTFVLAVGTRGLSGSATAKRNLPDDPT